ncbi:plant U-box 13 [Actinidia rufa]|uniref:Plant U-box 13 n=1 Tax=Actinidia rufa TaxID=165716 RepID=A0A7J0DCV1_9ERIC|nr:plant U-box 13 [Actinidia rufa]
MLRQIGILLIFFEEIRDRKLSLSKSAVLCFSELHLAFQKILFLFEDCTREGARLCILMKSHYVSTQFHLLIRTIATALDVLPLSSIEVSCEIRELVELVAKQARKAKLEIDPDDDSAMKRVILILNQFENKFEPDPSFIKRVLDYLEINNWSECHREIRILDEEISLECLDGSERELPLLSSLVGFMSYCRGVLFEAGPYGAFDQTVGVCDHKLLQFLESRGFSLPDFARTDDRSGDREKLPNTELVPNSTLRKLIHQFCADNGVSLSKSRNTNRDITRTIIACSPAAGGAIELLSDFLANRLYNGTREHKNKGAYEIRLLAKSNIFNRSCLIDAGTVPPLLNLLDSTDPTSQVNAISALLKLSKHDSGKKAIVENGGLKSILSVLKRGLNLEVRQISAAIIFYLSSVHGYRKLIGATPGAIPALVELIKEGTSCGKKNAVVAIFTLLLHHPNHQKVLEARTVPLLVDILAGSHTDELFTDSLAVLSTLADTMEGSIAILQTPALPVIICVLNSSATRAGKEYCARILLSLCNNCGDEVVSSLAKDTSLMNLLYSLVTDGTSHASKKARLLIKILHNFQETRSSQLTTRAAVPQERFIHVT